MNTLLKDEPYFLVEDQQGTTHTNGDGTLQGSNFMWRNVDIKSLINQLPEKLRSGGVLIDDGDFVMYVQIYFGTLLFFYLLMNAIRLFFIRTQNKRYLEKEEGPAWYYICLFVSNIFYLIVVYRASKLVFFTECPYDKVTRLPWLNNDLCFISVQKYGVNTLVFVMGYFSYDFIYQIYWTKGNDALHYQSQIHHCVVAFGLLLAFNCGYGYVLNANIAMLCEISTFFLNIRSCYKKEELNNRLPLICQVLLFISFVIFRVLLFPVMLYLNTKNIVITYPVVSGFRTVCGIISNIKFFLILALNYYWFTLILKGIYKLAIANGLFSSPNNDKVEQKEKDLNSKLIDDES